MIEAFGISAFKDVVDDYSSRLSDITQSVDAQNGEISDDDIDFLTITQAKRVHEIEKIKQVRVIRRAKEGELLEREEVKKVFAKFYAVHTGELHPLGDKVAQDMCAIFGDDNNEHASDARKAIDKHVFQALAHIKRLMDHFYRHEMR